MFYRIIMFILGIFFISFSLCFAVIYLNFLSMGYSFSEYVNFIISKGECLMFIPGILLIILAVWKRKEKYNDIYL